MKELEQSGFTDEFTYKEAKLSDHEMEMLQKRNSRLLFIA